MTSGAFSHRPILCLEILPVGIGSAHIIPARVVRIGSVACEARLSARTAGIRCAVALRAIAQIATQHQYKLPVEGSRSGIGRPSGFVRIGRMALEAGCRACTTGERLRMATHAAVQVVPLLPEDFAVEVGGSRIVPSDVVDGHPGRRGSRQIFFQFAARCQEDGEQYPRYGEER